MTVSVPWVVNSYIKETSYTEILPDFFLQNDVNLLGSVFGAGRIALVSQNF